MDKYKYKYISENKELNKFYKIENIEASELQKENKNNSIELEFRSGTFLNDTTTSLIFSKPNGLEEYNKLEKK